jgi:hypothetical protein
VTDYLDLDELSALLCIDPAAAYASVRSGEIAGIKTVGGWYVEREPTLRRKDSQ